MYHLVVEARARSTILFTTMQHLEREGGREREVLGFQLSNLGAMWMDDGRGLEGTHAQPSSSISTKLHSRLGGATPYDRHSRRHESVLAIFPDIPVLLSRYKGISLNHLPPSPPLEKFKQWRTRSRRNSTFLPFDE